MNIEMYIDRLAQLNVNYNMDEIIKAYRFAEESHKGQFRKSGERYVSHPIQVSIILAELELDEASVIAGLLHDVIEDTEYTFEDVEKRFGKTVAEIVDGVTKMGQIHYESKEERQAENLRKMLFAMSKDIRVILVKLADRLHNLRTLKYMSDEKKKEKAIETLEIFSPIAHRLGIFKIKWELEDLSLLYLDPEAYYDLVNKVKKKRDERESLIHEVIGRLKKELEDSQIEHDIYGRPKNFYSIYKKMKYQKKNFEEIHDITAVRVIVDSVKDCYGVLGIVHAMWKPIPRRFKDYIAMPKPNMYQSLHTTVLGDHGEPFEIQIRTHEMHRIAEYGIAAHWKYKESISKDQLGEGLTWIRQMMEWQKDLENPTEFLETVKLDLFNNLVYVFTPNGEVIELPDGSTPVDFAYKIHSAVGNSCVGAKVNGRIVPLNYQLKIGDIVEILTSKNSPGPSRDWLKTVKSSQAKNKIKSFFKKERRDENIEKGKEMLEREIKRQGFDLKEALSSDILSDILKRLSVKTLDDLYASVGYGGITTHQVIPKLREKLREEKKLQVEVIDKPPQQERNRKKSPQGVSVRGIDDILVRFAKCCNPVPGDDIIGFITRGRGVTVHRSDCTNFERTDEMKNRFIEVEWNIDENSNYIAEVQVIANDRSGLLTDITTVVQNTKLTVRGLNARVNEDAVAIISLSVEIQNVDMLNNLITKIKNLKGVTDVRRVTS